MSNSTVKIRSGITDTRSNKPCRSCGVLMDDAGTHFVCLACGYRMEKQQQPASEDISAWQKQVADLHSQKFLSAGRAQSEQLLAGSGPLRVLLFIALAGIAFAAPLQNLLHVINGSQAGPQAMLTAGLAALVLAIAGWTAFSQPGSQRIMQRNILGVLALACLAGLFMAAPLDSLLAAQYGALFDTAGAQEGMGMGIASTPAWWKAGLIMGVSFVALAGMSFISHREASEQMY